MCLLLDGLRCVLMVDGLCVACCVIVARTLLNPQVKLGGPRRLAPCVLEIEAIRTLSDIICRFYFLDGKAKAISISPPSTGTYTSSY